MYLRAGAAQPALKAGERSHVEDATRARRRDHDRPACPDGRTDVHHVAYWFDNAQDVLRACDILRENEIVADQGPCKHGVSQAFFTYVRHPQAGTGSSCSATDI